MDEKIKVKLPSGDFEFSQSDLILLHEFIHKKNLAEYLEECYVLSAEQVIQFAGEVYDFLLKSDDDSEERAIKRIFADHNVKMISKHM